MVELVVILTFELHAMYILYYTTVVGVHVNRHHRVCICVFDIELIWLSG